MMLSAHKVSWKTFFSVEKMKYINTQRSSAVLAVFLVKGCLASLLKNQNRREEKVCACFLSIQPKLFHKESEKKAEILTTHAFNHLKAKNSLPDKVKIKPNIKTEQYNPFLI